MSLEENPYVQTEIGSDLSADQRYRFYNTACKVHIKVLDYKNLEPTFTRTGKLKIPEEKYLVQIVKKFSSYQGYLNTQGLHYLQQRGEN